MIWTDLLTKRIKGQENNVPWYLHDKIKCNDFCLKNNILAPEIFKIFSSAEEINFDNLKDNNFILKPTLESSTKGVMVLEKHNNIYYDHLSKKEYSQKAIIDLQNELFIKNKNKSNKIIIEEKINDIDPQYQVPRDFKFYTFNGHIGAILQINRNTKPSSVTWYTENFEILSADKISSNAKYVHLVNDNNVPINWPLMLEIAKSISKKINTPFASIDMYSSSKGPMLGEVTLAPGGLYHGVHYLLSDDENKKWGEYWREAYNQLTL